MAWPGPQTSPQRNYPLPHPEAPSAREDVQRILDALMAIDADMGGVLAALDAKAAPADIEAAIASLINGAPAALDTLNELANALGSNENAIAALTAQIAGKADAEHAHTITDVAGLQAALDGKAPAAHTHDGIYAPAAHTHAIADVTGLQSALAQNVVHKRITAPILYASATTHWLTDFDVTITPSAANSLIEIIFFINYETVANSAFFLKRDGVEIGSADPAGSRLYGFAALPYDRENATTMASQVLYYIDAPGTTAPVSYELHRRGLRSVFAVNRTIRDGNNAFNERATSSVTIREIRQ